MTEMCQESPLEINTSVHKPVNKVILPNSRETYLNISVHTWLNYWKKNQMEIYFHLPASSILFFEKLGSPSICFHSSSEIRVSISLLTHLLEKKTTTTLVQSHIKVMVLCKQEQGQLSITLHSFLCFFRLFWSLFLLTKATKTHTKN